MAIGGPGDSLRISEATLADEWTRTMVHRYNWRGAIGTMIAEHGELTVAERESMQKLFANGCGSREA